MYYGLRYCSPGYACLKCPYGDCIQYVMRTTVEEHDMLQFAMRQQEICYTKKELASNTYKLKVV